jgi:hypothetical protein
MVATFPDGGAERDDARSRLASNFRQFQALKSEALGSLRRGRLAAAAVQAETAASYTYFHHSGLWASPELERLLTEIGREALDSGSQAELSAPDGGPRRVLHVLTRIASIGGHSRMVWRWIEEDDLRSHSVVLTRQGAIPIPPQVLDATSRRGGRVYSLNRKRGSILDWSQRLRDLATGFDVIVMHLFAEDVIPMIAFAERAGLPPILFVDQADHAFSLGPALADVYVGLREAGIELAVKRRGVARARAAELPITLPAHERSLTRAQAREHFGWASDRVIMLSIARAPKYRTFQGQHYADQFRGLLDRHAELMLVVVGPQPDEAWHRLAHATDGRVIAFAERPDTKTFYEAADIYIDSFPIISNTSLLEAGSYSLPLVSRCRLPGAHTIYCADAPGFAGHIFRSSDPREITAAIERLVTDPLRRRDTGEQTRLAIAAAHSDVGWRNALERLYEQAMAIERVDPMANVQVDTPRSEDVDLIWYETHGSSVTLDDVRSYYVKGLPFELRLRTWLGITRRQRRVRPQLMAPEWITAPAREWVDRVRGR